MSAANTNFMNAQHRRIYQGAKGAFFVKRADGKKVYGIRASFRKVGANGVETKLNKSNRNTVPSPLRRAVRKNAGVKRGPLKNGAVRKAPAARARKAPVRAPKAPLMLTMYSNANMRAAARAAKPRAARKPRAVRSPNQGFLQRAMNTASNRAAVARAKRALKPAGVRKVRKNAGIKRGPLKNGAVRKVPVRARKSPVRKAPLMLTMYSNANMRAAARAAKPRAVRARKVVSPNQGRLQRAMNTASNRAAVARARRALKPRAVRKPRVVRSPNQGFLQRAMNTASNRTAAAKKKALSRVKAMNELLMAISPNPFNMLAPPKRKVRKNVGVKRGPRRA